MVRERYVPRDNQWVSYPEADWRAFIAAVESQVGAEVPLSIQPDGSVILDAANLPSGVTENDVKNAIKDNHPHR